MRFLLAIVLLFVAGCSDIRVTTLLAMDFAEEEDAALNSFTQDGNPGVLFLMDQNRRGVRDAVSIRNGKLFLTDAPRALPNTAVFAPRQDPRAFLTYTYTWRAELNEARSTSGTGSIVDFVLEGIEEPPNLPPVAARIRLESVDAPDGRRITVTTDAADEPIGVLRVGASHSITMRINIEDQTFRVFGGNVGGIDSGELPLLGTIRPSFVPPLRITPVNARAASVEYTFENMRILSFEPTP